jgi:hypothetical protein
VIARPCALTWVNLDDLIESAQADPRRGISTKGRIRLWPWPALYRRWGSTAAVGSPHERTSACCRWTPQTRRSAIGHSRTRVVYGIGQFWVGRRIQTETLPVPVTHRGHPPRMRAGTLCSGSTRPAVSCRCCRTDAPGHLVPSRTGLCRSSSTGLLGLSAATMARCWLDIPYHIALAPFRRMRVSVDGIVSAPGRTGCHRSVTALILARFYAEG